MSLGGALSYGGIDRTAVSTGVGARAGPQTSFAISVHQLSMSDVSALYTACGEAETRHLVEYEAALIFHPLM